MNSLNQIQSTYNYQKVAYASQNQTTAKGTDDSGNTITIDFNKTENLFIENEMYHKLDFSEQKKAITEYTTNLLVSSHANLSENSQLNTYTFRKIEYQNSLEITAEIDPGFNINDYSAEKVSDRIVDLAKAFSTGDPKIFEEMKSAIEEGFQEAEKLLGFLPDISKETIALTKEKLDDYEKSIRPIDLQLNDAISGFR